MNFPLSTALFVSHKVPVYLTGEFFADALNWPAGTAAEDVKTAFRALGIFLK